MGFWEQFPYTNFHELNLDWLLQDVKNLKSYVEQYTAINKVTYGGVWSIDKSYPIWSIVTTDGASYMTLKPTPSGVEINNEDYWLKLAEVDPRIPEILNRIDVLRSNIEDLDRDIGNLHGDIDNLQGNIDNLQDVDSVIRDDIAGLENRYIKLANNTSVISVLNYGAKGDGLTDDTAAFQNTINACIPHGVVVIPFTGKSYVIKGSIDVNKPIKIVGLYAGLEPYGAATTDISAVTMETPLIEHRGGYCFDCSCLGIEFNNISIRTTNNGFKFTGLSLTSGRYGRYIHLSNCTVYCTSADGTGFNFNDCFRIVAENCNAFGGHRPFVLDTLTSSVFVSCWARDFTNTGWTILNSVYTSLISCACDVLDGTDGRHGYYIADSNNISMVSCGVENTDDALIMDNSRGVSGNFYCANVGANENSFIVQVGNYCSLALSGCVSSVNRKISAAGAGTVVNVSTCDRLTHFAAGGAEIEIPYGFWSSTSI